MTRPRDIPRAEVDVDGCVLFTDGWSDDLCHLPTVAMARECLAKWTADLDAIEGKTWTPGDPTLEAAYEVLENETGGCLDVQCPNLDPIRKAKAIVLAALDAAPATEMVCPEDFRPMERYAPDDKAPTVCHDFVGRVGGRIHGRGLGVHFRASGPHASRGFLSLPRGVPVRVLTPRPLTDLAEFGGRAVGHIAAAIAETEPVHIAEHHRPDLDRSDGAA